MSGGYVDPSFPNPGGAGDAPIIIYGYTPNIVLCIVALVTFSLLFLAHSFLCLKHRTWTMLPLVFGVLMEIAGYICRTLSSKVDPYLVIYFVIQYFLIVVAPVFFSATIYTYISVLLNRLGNVRDFSPISGKTIVWIFVVSDVVETIVQIAGAALIGAAYSNEKDPTSANHILLGGLAAQVFTFAVFCALLAVVLTRSWSIQNPKQKTFSLALVAATLFVYLRTIFRLAETAQGLEKDLSTHEGYFGGLEYAPIVLALTVLAVFHPGRLLGRGESRRERKERVRSEKEARNVQQTDF